MIGKAIEKLKSKYKGKSNIKWDDVKDGALAAVGLKATKKEKAYMQKELDKELQANQIAMDSLIKADGSIDMIALKHMSPNVFRETKLYHKMRDKFNNASPEEVKDLLLSKKDRGAKIINLDKKARAKVRGKRALRGLAAGGTLYAGAKVGEDD